MSKDYSHAVVAVGLLARKLQAASANPLHTADVYKVATEIMFECQYIREVLQPPPKTLKDYIKRVLQ